MFITAKGFFQLRFMGSPYEDNFQNYFSVAFMGTNLLVVGSSILIQKQVMGKNTNNTNKDKESTQRRIVGETDGNK